MAKGGYIGDGNNKARKVKKGYIGDSSGKARKVKKGYIGDVNGKARLFWTSNINTLVAWSPYSYNMNYSTNLQSWTNGATDTATFTKGTYGNDRFVRFRPDIVSYSENGITWTQATHSPSLNLNPYEFIDGKFIGYMGIRNGTNTYYTSTNGYTWISNSLNMNSTSFLSFSPYRVIKANSTYVMIGRNDQTDYTYGMVFTSNDMINWNEKYHGVNRRCTDIAYGNGKCVVIGLNYDDSGFTLVSDDLFNTATIGYSAEYISISFGNGVFVAINGSLSNPSVDYSTDGYSWTRGLNFSSYTERRQISVVFTGEKFYTIGDYGYSYYSENGMNWTQMTGLDSSVTYSNLLYSIDGGGRQPLTS